MSKSPAAPALGFLPDLLGYQLRRAQLAVFQDFAATVDGGGITPGQFGVLALIDLNPGMTQTRLGQILGIDRSTVVGVIDALEHLDLVTRTKREDDRRAHALFLSAGGRRRFAALAKKVRAHEARIARTLDARERKQLIALLRKIAPADQAR